jgi:phage baseplate assembly protein W
MAINKRYSDLDLNFSPHPVSGDVGFKYDEEAVKRSIRNLVFMGIHDKPFHPEIRSEVRKLLFENFSSVTGFEIEREIEDIIKEHEPRAKLIDVSSVIQEDRNKMDITVVFKVVGFPDSTHNINLPLERIR